MDIVGSGSNNNFGVSSSSSSSKGGGGGGAGAGGGAGVTAVSSDSSSLNGLKFGKKIYFEDVGIGVSAKSVAGSTSICVPDGIPLSPPTPATSRNRRNVVQGGKPPRCQVEGCKLDLSDIKAYYSRHKVCAMHSKSPKVIVAGLEQRFCQQCSRFHQLAEFDQGKRSCRRRLAGHNERRRKPQPGSLLSSRYGRLSASLQDSSRGGGFVMDFAAYPRMSGRDGWTTSRTSADQPSATGKFLALQYPPANVFYQGSHTYMQGSSAAGGSVFSSSRIPPGECFAGVSDSGCALSLLSNQSWDPRNNQASSSVSVNNLMNGEGAPMVSQSTAPNQGAVSNSYTVSSWAFKGNDEGGGRGNSHEVHHHDLGLGQVTSQPMNANHQFSGGELELAHHAVENRQYMELAHSRAYDTSSVQQMHWSL